MPTSLTLDAHVAALEAAGTRLLAAATDTGMDQPVPTCPAWTVHHLVAHQAMVHRWAAAHVRGEDADAAPDQTEIRETVADLSGYYEAGLHAIAAALLAAPPDLKAMTFLKDAPAPREFWARRQAHETTIHMVDALSATVGGTPTALEADIHTALAVDGIDELLRGFMARGKSKLFDGDEFTVTVAPVDHERRWVVRVAERLSVDPGDGEVAGATDATLAGTAAQLYLGLWNRGDEIEATGRPAVLERWRATQRVSWS